MDQALRRPRLERRAVEIGHLAVEPHLQGGAAVDVEIAGAGEQGALEQAVEGARGVEIDGDPGGRRRRGGGAGTGAVRDGRRGAPSARAGIAWTVKRGHRLGLQGRGGGRLRLLLGNVLALHREDLRDLARGADSPCGPGSRPGCAAPRVLAWNSVASRSCSRVTSL